MNWKRRAKSSVFFCRKINHISFLALTKKAGTFLYTVLVKQKDKRGDEGIYELYWDLYFIENLILDGIMLMLTLFLMRKRISIRRIMIAAFVGASASTCMLVFSIHFGLLYILILLGMGIAMMEIVMKQKSRNEILLGMVYYFTLAFVFSKLLKGGEWITKNRVSGIVLVALVIVVMSIILFFVIYQSRKNGQNTIYQVSIQEQGRRMDVKALYDTGNVLRDPISGKPVSIVESDAWYKMMPEPRPEHYKVIPFHSIGQEHGILKGMEIEEMIIWAGDQKIVLKQAIIALYEGSLSKDESFQMILHQGLLNLGG